MQFVNRRYFYQSFVTREHSRCTSFITFVGEQSQKKNGRSQSHAEGKGSDNLSPQVRMGIAGVVRDKDTELGIADAVIAVDELNHDVTTGVCGREGSVEVWEGFRLGQMLRIIGS